MDNSQRISFTGSSSTRAELFDNRIMVAEKFLTVDEVAEALNVSGAAIRKWRMQGRIPYHKLGRSLRFRASEVFAALKGERQ